MSVKYDNTELQNATYVPRYFKHESSPERLLNSVKLARQNGEIIVDDTMSIKYIEVAGVLIGTSQSDLETKIDAFKELINRKDKNLDISWAGGTRRYVCRSITHEFNRDFYHLSYVPYSIKFFIPAGCGKDTASTSILDLTGGTAITATTSTQALTFAGSTPPKPVHRITVNTRGNADVLRVENTDTGDYMDIDLLTVDANGIVNNDYIEIDEENMTVKRNGSTDWPYRGKFPSVVVGVNNLKLTIIGSGSTLDTDIDVAGTDEANFVNSGWSSAPRGMQSFVPTQSGRIYKITPSVARHQNGGLGGELRFYVFDDANGVPDEDGPLSASSKFPIAYANVPDTSASFVDALYSSSDDSRPFVVKGRRYWIYLLPNGISGGNSLNHYIWRTNNVPVTYPSGKAMFLKTAGDPYIDGFADASQADGGEQSQCDMAVKIYRGGDGGAANHNVDWKIDYVKKYL